MVFGRQESAPTDVSGLIMSIYDRMNEDLDDVLKLEINYVGGVIHRYAGVATCSFTTSLFVGADGNSHPSKWLNSSRMCCYLTRITSV